jgi:hypothetical protein
VLRNASAIAEAFSSSVSRREVVALVRTILSELDELGLTGAIKRSGSRGLHIALPMPPRTPFESALRVAQTIAARVVERNPTRAPAPQCPHRSSERSCAIRSGSTRSHLRRCRIVFVKLEMCGALR